MKSQMIIYADELSAKWIDKAVSAGVDILGLHPTGGGRAIKSLTDLIERLKTDEYRALIDYAYEKGIKIEYEIHAAGYLMPRELFDEHPEYFRMNEKGERVRELNFCVSNKEALSIFSERAAELASNLYRSTNNLYFWMDDSGNSHCSCPLCKELSPSDQQMIAVNAMIRRIKKQNPDAKMAYLAYIDTITPPSVEADEGVFLEYAPYKKYTAKGENAEAIINKEFEMAEKLVEYFGEEDAKVLEYWYDNSLFSGWKRPPKEFTLNAGAMEKDIQYYKNMGFSYMSTFACFLGTEYEELYGECDIVPFGRACNK